MPPLAGLPLRCLKLVGHVLQLRLNYPPDRATSRSADEKTWHRAPPVDMRKERNGESDDLENTGARLVRGHRGRRWRLRASLDVECGRFRARRPQRRSVAVGVCVRHELFLGSYLCRVCRPVRLEIRPFGNMGGHRKCHLGLASGLVGARPPRPRNDPSSEGDHHARVLRQTLQLQGIAHRGCRHHLRVSHPLYGKRLQRPFAPDCHRVRHQHSL